MKSFAIVFGVLALVLIWWNLWISIQIVKYLKKEGEDASLFQKGFFIKGKIFEYLPKYKELTIKKTGKAGRYYSLFYITFIGMLVMLLFGILAVSGVN